MSNFIDELKRKDHKRYLGGLDFFKYIGRDYWLQSDLSIRELGVQFCSRFGVWLRSVMGCHTFYDNVDCLTA